MGRIKREIKKIETSSGRQTTYVKRKQGILKKAEELSILCDVGIVLVMISPAGTPSLCCGKNSIEEVIDKFSHVPAEERTKRMIEGFEALKKTFEKVDHEIDVQESLHASLLTSKDVTNQAKVLQNRLSEIQKRLSCWANLGSVNDIELLAKMEDSVKESLIQIQRHKEEFRNQQPLSFESYRQSQADADPPLHLPAEQEHQSHYLETNKEQMVRQEEPKLPAQRREVELSASFIFGDYNAGGSPITMVDIKSHEYADKNYINSSVGIASPGQLIDGDSQCLPHNFNMLAGHTLHAILQVNQQGSSCHHIIVEGCQPPGICDSSNHLLHKIPVHSLYAELLHYQWLSRVPSALLPSNYRRMEEDPNQLFLELLNVLN